MRISKTQHCTALIDGRSHIHLGETHESWLVLEKEDALLNPSW